MRPSPDPLLGLLLGRLGPGVWSATSVPDDVAARAEALGWTVRSIELTPAGEDEKRDTLAAVARSLEFPAHYRPNWDATADSLTELGLRPHTPTLVIVRGREGAPSTEVDRTLATILDEAAIYWEALGSNLTTLWVGPDAIGIRQLGHL